MKSKFKFWIQSKEDKTVMHDFGFHLIEAINYDVWWSGDTQYLYELIENVSDIIPLKGSINIPIGSVEFVLSFYKEFHSIDIKPVDYSNIDGLSKYFKRKINYNFKDDDLVFVKSRDEIKGYTDIIKYKDRPKDKNLFISEIIDIKSEWRAFVYYQNLLDVRMYSGELNYFPDIREIENMIKDYGKEAPTAYTIDIGVNNDGTFLIEIHDFFSCGLYGFADYKNLPLMFITVHYEILKRRS